MYSLDNFQQHIDTLTRYDWNRLFDLLPEIESERDAHKSLEEVSSNKIQSKLLDLIYELEIIPHFGWSNWDEGIAILKGENSNYSELDTITLCKLITTITRADRFNEGYMRWCIRNGVFTKIIKALQNKVLDNGITYQIKSVLFGVAVGDALGIPIEFNSRLTISQNPVTDMLGYGTYNLPPGTWSDDSSLTFCLTEALIKGFDLNEIADNFVKWYYNNYWTPRGNVFDIGLTTRQAIERIAEGVQPDLAASIDVSSNGNGSLMRISPLLFYLLDKPIEQRFEITKQVSSITHAHICSVIACFYYLEFARKLFLGIDKFDIYKNLQSEISDFLQSMSIDSEEIAIFNRLLKQNIFELTDENIYSSGYVLHTLEACIWCLLTTDNYRDAVLKAVNLGEDTDTTGAVVGGLAGLLYGFDSIPANWINQLARCGEIENLVERFANKIISN